MKRLLFILCMAVPLLAQPVVGTEVVSAPIEALGDAAVIPQGDGFLMAWSHGDQVNVGRLDATLHLIGAPLTMSLSAPVATAPFVTLASDGTSVFVAWSEKRLGFGDSIFAATLTPDAKTLMTSPRLITITGGALIAGVVKNGYVLVAGNQSFVLTKGLETESATTMASPLSIAVSSHGDVGTLSVVVTPRYNCQGCGIGCFGSCSTLETFTFATPALTKTVLLAYGLSSEMKTPPVHDPVIAMDGDHFAGVIVKNLETDVFELNGGEPGRAWTLAPLPLPGIIALAGNGSDVLVVWWEVPALRGIVLHKDGSTSEPFVIAQNAYKTPKVVPVSSNDFLVTNVYDVDTNHSALAGRLIHLQPTRQRAVR